MSDSIYSRIFCAIQSLHLCALCWFMRDLLFIYRRFSHLDFSPSGLFYFFQFHFRAIRSKTTSSSLTPLNIVCVLPSSVGVWLLSCFFPPEKYDYRPLQQLLCCVSFSEKYFQISIFLFLIYLWWSAPLVSRESRGPFETGTFFFNSMVVSRGLGSLNIKEQEGEEKSF